MDAALGATGDRSDAYERMLAAIGEPGADSALSTLATGARDGADGGDRLAAVDGQARPTRSTPPRTLAGVGQPRSPTRTCRLRTEADAEIARQVGQVNDALHAIDDINRKIASAGGRRASTSPALQDERGRLIDGISAIVPVRAVKRDGDQVALYSAERRRCCSTAGSSSSASRRPPNVVTPDMTLGAAARRADAGPGRRRRAGGGRGRHRRAGSSTAARSARSSRCATGSCRSSTPRSTATPTT